MDGRPFRDDIYLFNTGNAREAYNTFGCHFLRDLDKHRFAVWAPNARSISVVGDFNGWNPMSDPMKNDDGVWTAFVEGLHDGDNYKYFIEGFDGSTAYKADPFGFHCEVRPNTASKVWDIGGYEWHDDEFLKQRRERDVFTSPMSIYELHLGSWRVPEGYRFPSVRETADELADYVTDMGYTHVELMPIMEHPFDGSWGYQVTNYYAPTSRYGTPQDYMYFIDTMHAHGISVILDWVPAHFPKDESGLRRFDGTCLFEHENPLQGEQPQWGTLVFNYGRPEVVSFLMSNLFYWTDMYHADGFRFDAVSSMLYLDYGRENGSFIRNKFGGNYNLDAISFIKKVNAELLGERPGVVTVAEESTSYPMVTMPPYDGGLGFSFKWNMGFMNDTLRYFEMDPLFRKNNQNLLTFAMMYTGTENFILPYSHDEVVHGKKSMIDKAPGDYWKKFATLRSQYGFMFSHPGKKLLFMGSDFAQFIEWDEKRELDWFLLGYDAHRQMRDYVRDLLHIYRQNRSLFETEGDWNGFKWLEVSNPNESTLAFMRTSLACNGEAVRTICAFNFTPVVRRAHHIGLPCAGILRQTLNSDDKKYGGSGVSNEPEIIADEGAGPEGLPYFARITLPPLSAVYFDFEPTKAESDAEYISTEESVNDH